jgi:hypothetical protein
MRRAGEITADKCKVLLTRLDDYSCRKLDTLESLGSQVSRQANDISDNMTQERNEHGTVHMVGKSLGQLKSTLLPAATEHEPKPLPSSMPADEAPYQVAQRSGHKARHTLGKSWTCLRESFRHRREHPLDLFAALAMFGLALAATGIVFGMRLMLSIARLALIIVVRIASRISDRAKHTRVWNRIEPAVHKVHDAVPEAARARATNVYNQLYVLADTHTSRWLL